MTSFPPHDHAGSSPDGRIDAPGVLTPSQPLYMLAVRATVLIADADGDVRKVIDDVRRVARTVARFSAPLDETKTEELLGALHAAGLPEIANNALTLPHVCAALMRLEQHLTALAATRTQRA